MSRQLTLCPMTMASVLLAGRLLAGELATINVQFSPAVTQQLREQYGAEQEAVLRAAIVSAVSREVGKIKAPAGLGLTVTVDTLAPSHPTPQQSAANPSLDPVRTKYLGGAKLTGTLTDAGGELVGKVVYDHFPPNLHWGSASLDPWADARLAIDGFAAKVAATCRRLTPQT